MCDDPEAHAELEKALFRLQETIREVNKAKDDPRTRRLIEITWQLQDRLVFQEQVMYTLVECWAQLTRYRQSLVRSCFGYSDMSSYVVSYTYLSRPQNA